LLLGLFCAGATGVFAAEEPMRPADTVSALPPPTPAIIDWRPVWQSAPSSSSGYGGYGGYGSGYGSVYVPGTSWRPSEPERRAPSNRASLRGLRAPSPLLDRMPGIAAQCGPGMPCLFVEPVMIQPMPLPPVQGAPGSCLPPYQLSGCAVLR
jgi:hypothetical protein